MAIFDSIFATPLGQAVLVFIFLFTLIFAILQKSGILGKDKKQIDALVAFSSALLAVGVGSVLDITTKMLPFLAIALVVIFVFLVIASFFYKPEEFSFSGGVKTAFSIAALIAVIIAAGYFTGAWGKISSLFEGTGNLLGNIIFAVIVVVAVWFVLSGKSGKDTEN